MANYHLYTAVFEDTAPASDFAGTTISCLLGKQLQEVQKSVSKLIYLCSHKGRLNSTSVWYSACLVVTVYR
jgi:hypothetical protein